MVGKIRLPSRIGNRMSDAKVYVISDTHFGHKNILKYESEFRGHYKTIEEHDWDLVARWNSVVRKKDTVWHLGDVYFGKDGPDILAALKGFKRLVMGNHDSKKDDILIQYFDRLYGVAEYGNCVLSHIPVHPYQLEKRYKKNIHGHMHSNKLDDPRYVCGSVEHTNLTPILLQQAIQHGT